VRIYIPYIQLHESTRYTDETVVRHDLNQRGCVQIYFAHLYEALYVIGIFFQELFSDCDSELYRLTFYWLEGSTSGNIRLYGVYRVGIRMNLRIRSSETYTRTAPMMSSVWSANCRATYYKWGYVQIINLALLVSIRASSCELERKQLVPVIADITCDTCSYSRSAACTLSLSLADPAGGSLTTAVLHVFI
jgi:hypothetical protein